MNVTIIQRGRVYFVRTTDGARIVHDGPWRTLYAAQKCAELRASGRYPPTDMVVHATSRPTRDSAESSPYRRWGRRSRMR